MPSQLTRRAAVAGTWYPGTAEALGREVDRYLSAAPPPPAGHLLALIAPHAGLMYSGPVAAYAYAALVSRRFETAVLVGPSHHVGFDGVALPEADWFDTPFGAVRIDRECADRLAAASPLVRTYPAAHAREHSVEMQLPFLLRLLPEITIVPLVMGYQTHDTVVGLAGALERVLPGRDALLIASTDLSHYHDSETAAALDGRVAELVRAFDAEGLLTALERCPDHACGGGPTVSVMLAARGLGAADAAVLKYADSGDVSGDKTAVVGYLAAALGNFSA